MVLGKLYRGVKIDDYYNQCISLEYSQSVKYQYKMSYFLESHKILTAKTSGIGLEEHGRYLTQVYSQVVQPMTRNLKELMYEKRLLNEAEMFCTDLEFRVDD